MSFQWSFRLVLALALGVCGVCCNCAFAQFQSGVEATVVDTTGAAIPGAEVQITNLATAVTQKL